MEKLELIKKAWIVWHDGMLDENPHQGFTLNTLPVTYSDSANEAKLISSTPYDYYLDGKEPKYIDLKVRRAKNADKVMYLGNITRRDNVLLSIRHEEIVSTRKDKIDKYPDDAKFYIQNGYVGNAILWWAIDSRGYVCDITKAQAFTKDEVLKRFVNGRDEDRIWESSHVLANIKPIVDCQNLNAKYVS